MAVGSDEPVAALAGPAPTILDLDGRLVIAGVNDAHDHIREVPFGRVVSTVTPPLADPPLDEVMAAVARASADPPDHERRLSFGRREGRWAYAATSSTRTVRRYAASLAPSAAITQMTTLSYERLGSVFFALGSILLAVYAALFVLLLPSHDGDFDYVRLVTSPHWRSIALIAFVGVVSLLTGLEAVYSRIRDSAGILGATGLVLTKVALVLQACVLTWEMLMDPLIAAHPESAFLLRDGGIINAPWMVAFRWVFLLTILGGALLFGLAVLRSKQFPMPAIGLLIAGAVLYAVGPRVSVFIAISGVILFAIGGLLIGARLWRATAA